MINFIFMILSSVFYIFTAICVIKKQKNTGWNLILVAFFCIIFIPCFFLTLDQNDFFSKLGWFKNTNPDNWFSFFSNYVSALLGSVLSGAFLICITLFQLKKTDNDNLKKDMNNRRLQNYPILDYSISNTITGTKNIIYLFLDGLNNYSLFIDVQNIGLNHAKNLKLHVKSSENDKGKNIDESELPKFLKLNDIFDFELVFCYDYNEEGKNRREITLEFLYSDLLNNIYEQRIIINVEITNQSGSQYGGHKLNILSSNIENEKLCIDSEEK